MEARFSIGRAASIDGLRCRAGAPLDPPAIELFGPVSSFCSFLRVQKMHTPKSTGSDITDDEQLLRHGIIQLVYSKIPLTRRYSPEKPSKPSLPLLWDESDIEGSEFERLLRKCGVTTAKYEGRSSRWVPYWPAEDFLHTFPPPNEI